MRLFFDENIGYRVPQALRLVQVEGVEYLVEKFGSTGKPAQGVKDEQWIPEVGDEYLVISRDVRLLRRARQRAMLVEHHVGLVCITSPYASPRDMLLFMLSRMSRLEQLNEQTKRPFAFRTSLNGPFARVL